MLIIFCLFFFLTHINLIKIQTLKNEKNATKKQAEKLFLII